MVSFKPPSAGSMTKKYGPKKINPGTGRLNLNMNKGMKMLPGRSALNRLTKGDPSERSFQSYAKATPSGAGAPMSYQNIMDMGLSGANVTPEDE